MYIHLILALRARAFFQDTFSKFLLHHQLNTQLETKKISGKHNI